MIIPKQLSKQRFIHVGSNKRPLEKGWPDDKNYSYEEFKPNNIYGVLCGYNKLVVVDVDKKYIQDKLILLEEFRNTFIVKSANKKLYHFYFYVDIENPKGFRLDNSRKERIMDLQGIRTQVLGPGSKIDNIGLYEIVNNNEILYINYEYLKNILLNIEDNINISSESGIKKTKSEIVFPEFDETCAAIKSKLTIHDILPHLGITPNDNKTPCECPLAHESENKQCFSYTDQVFHCFHCGQSGNLFQLWMKSKKIKFMEARHELAKIAGIEQSFKQRIKDLMIDPKHRGTAIELLSREFKKLYHVYTIRHDIKPEMFIYKDGIYKPNGESYIYEYVRNIIDVLYQDSYANKVIEKIRVDTYIDEDIFYQETPLNLIPFNNCILDLEINECLDYDPKLRFMNKHPVNYDPIQKPELILKFLKDITKGEKDLKTLQEISGYCLWRENKFEKSIMLLGNGRNGKSKFIELLKEMLGYQNVVNISLSDIEKNNFALSNLHNKHANFSPDLSKEVLENTGNFKSLIGRDTITADRKHKSAIHFKNYSKFIFATNNLPYTMDQSDGFFDRWVIIDFPFKFVDVPTKTYEKLKDANIIDKITTPKEMSGFVNWALEGLHRLFKRGDFTISDTTDDIKNKWLRESSSITGFWQECIEYTSNRKDNISLSDFETAYSNYCMKHKLEQDNRNVKNSRLNQLGAAKVKSGGKWIYRNIKFKGNYVLEEYEEVDGF
jgi:P4 family phage/plasmid primase-like protien